MWKEERRRYLPATLARPPYHRLVPSVGLIVSVLGAYLPGVDADGRGSAVRRRPGRGHPRFLRRATADDVPIPALVMTTILVQIVLIVTSFSEDAFNSPPI